MYNCYRKKEKKENTKKESGVIMGGNILNYENLLNMINISSKEIEKQISEIKLLFFDIRNDLIEYKMHVPIFVYPFYNFIVREKRLPTQEEYWNEYINVNKEWFAKTSLSEDLIKALKARAYRTYPSLVRDIHFNKLASESGLFESVIYNDKLDVEDGVDLLVLKNNKCFAVNLYTKTRRAIESRFKKAYRHKKLDDSITNVEFPVEFKGSVKCGNFFLYGIDDIKRLAEICN